MALRRGFKAEADRHAIAVRADLGLTAHAPLDPHQLAADLDVPVVTITELGAMDGDARVVELLARPRGPVSALTVFRGHRRIIVVNDAHSIERRNSDLAHELAHSLLLHEPAQALNVHGQRHWDGDLEEEANWLSGNLLIPDGAARRLARIGTPSDEARALYGVSHEMLTWRLNMSGARKVRRRRQ